MATIPDKVGSLGAMATIPKEDLQLKVEKVLACPCMASLQEGQCAKEFSKAFVCFIKSSAEHKGSDCVESFLNLQACMLDHPDAFSRHKTEETQKEQMGDKAHFENPVS